MGKRSDKPRIDKDKYFTWDRRAYPSLLAHLPDKITFAEPCAGDGDMVYYLESCGHKCNWASDIDSPRFSRVDALELDSSQLHNCEYIITNPPWSRKILHQMIEKFVSLGKPTWLLFDSGWAFTRQAVPYLRHCKTIVPNPRLKWIRDSEFSAKDDTAWYLFDSKWNGDYTMLKPLVTE